MTQDEIVKFTLSAQIAAQIAKEYCKLGNDADKTADDVVDLTNKIVKRLLPND